ncbi:MAG: hypothetical protein HYU64_21550 [Armatimonadetes bacterium]|nr:hypothetical protein [Armatimonadota bacterium]
MAQETKDKNDRVRRGATLNEVILATAIFSTVIICVFGVFHLGNENWRLINLRHSLQNDGKRSIYVLRNDLLATHYTSVSVLNIGGQFNLGTKDELKVVPVYRDAVSLAFLVDRTNSDNFTAGGKQIWNRYVIYYATKPLDPDDGSRLTGGRLVREVILDTTVPVNESPYSNFAATEWLKDDPYANTGAVNKPGPKKVESLQILAQDVLHFSVTKNDDAKSVQATLKLFKKANLHAKGRNTSDETFQLDLKVQPENSSP